MSDFQFHSLYNSVTFFCRLWLSGYYEDKDLVNHVKAINYARKAAIAANSEFLSTAVRPSHLLKTIVPDPTP